MTSFSLVNERDAAARVRQPRCSAVVEPEDLGPQDGLVEVELTVQLSHRGGAAGHVEHRVNALGLAADLEGETTATPDVNGFDASAIGTDDIAERIQRRCDGAFFQFWVKNDHDFVSAHQAADLLWTSGGHDGCRSRRAADAGRTWSLAQEGKATPPTSGDSEWVEAAVTLLNVPDSRCDVIAFDLDGVLLDADIHFTCLNAALAPYSTQISRDEHLSTFNGLPTAVKLRMLSELGRLPDDAHPKVFQRKQALTLSALSRILETADDRNREMFLAVRAQGLRTAVVTNAVRATLDAFLLGDDLSDLVDASVAGNEVARAKPSPDCYLRTAELLGVKPQQMLAIEDNHHGIESAQAAGCRVLVVSGPRTFTAFDVLAAANVH